MPDTVTLDVDGQEAMMRASLFSLREADATCLISIIYYFTPDCLLPHTAGQPRHAVTHDAD